ncbi:MAG: shikimate dehydrogenase, partial [Gammaproteobacteria bacterium]|nr:shikimate dehydrogenase [Gammaproteobacteria bacterium]
MTDIFDFSAPPPLFAVMGNPVAHSKSPQIHQLFAEQCGVRLQYDRIQVDVGGFEQAVQHFKSNGGRGLNITVPFKVEAWRLADELSPRAQRAEAVNTLKFEDDSLLGDNTDGIGLVIDLEQNLQCSLAKKNILVL